MAVSSAVGSESLSGQQAPYARALPHLAVTGHAMDESLTLYSQSLLVDTFQKLLTCKLMQL
jgi:hypothetical protein